MATVAIIQEALARVHDIREAFNAGVDASDLFHDGMTRPWAPADKLGPILSLYPTSWWPHEPKNVA